MNCPICGGPLHFDGVDHQLNCDSFHCPFCCNTSSQCECWFYLIDGRFYHGRKKNLTPIQVKEFKRKVASARLIGAVPSQ